MDGFLPQIIYNAGYNQMQQGQSHHEGRGKTGRNEATIKGKQPNPKYVSTGIVL